jgi:hypothetical protein
VKKLALTFFLVTSSESASDFKEFRGGVLFNYKAHQTVRVGKCFVCHDNISVSNDEKKVTTSNPGKIKGFGHINTARIVMIYLVKAPLNATIAIKKSCRQLI